MSEEIPPLASASPPAGADEALNRVALAEPALAYDGFKRMASISVATLGGILTLSGAVFGARIDLWQMGVAAVLVALARDMLGPLGPLGP